ncbi:MAG: endonuclease/exonuclease/phosphatase family protein [Candidatus Levybacteria bacterium]|nr:endonuclease/exonuclease/phosphatase family protein [Candidatus Levybacteria bacterium]
MKLISLNIWGGKIYKPLVEFIEKHSETTDIFCFQEVSQSNSGIFESSGYRMNIFGDLSISLKDFKGYFARTFKGYDMTKFVDFEVYFGIAIFVKKSFNITFYEDIFIHHVEGGIIKRKNYLETSRKLQFVQVKSENKILNVYNLHGIWTPDSSGGNKDSEERIGQSRKIEQFIQKQYGEKIVVGDLNLDPDTKSLKILENHLTNLIKKYNISSTRTSLYTRRHKFADYTLVSPGIKVINFEVPNINISDHRPMILEFT